MNGQQEGSLFKIKSIDKCICLTDQKYEPEKELYLTPDEAVRIGEILVEIGGKADYGKDLVYYV